MDIVCSLFRSNVPTREVFHFGTPCEIGTTQFCNNALPIFNLRLHVFLDFDHTSAVLVKVPRARGFSRIQALSRHRLAA